MVADDLEGICRGGKGGGQITVAVVKDKTSAHERVGPGVGPAGVVIAGDHVDGAG